MNYKTLRSIMDLLIFFLINIIFVDSFSIFMFVALIIWLMVYAVEKNAISEWTGFFIIALILIILGIFKFIIMIVYYNVFYKKVSNPIIIKLFNYLQENFNQQNIFKFIIFSPYLIGIFLSYVFDIKALRVQHLIQNCCLSVLSSGLISYSMLFAYWDYEKNLKDFKHAKAIVNVFKQHILSILVLLILIILTFIVSN